MKFRFTTLLWLLPLLSIVGFTAYRVREAMRAKAELTQPGGGAPSGRAPGGASGGGRAQVVQTGLVSSGRVAEKITLTGTLKPKEQVDVTPKIAGRITKLTVDIGQTVSRGTLIATIEDDEIQQQLERSKASLAVVDASIAQRDAELNNAKSDLERRRKLVDEGVLPRSELDTLEMRVRVAQSQFELTRAQRRQSEAEQRELAIRQSQTRIFAPINGVISNRQLTLGALAGTNNPIVTIVSVNPMVIEAKASERDIARIKRGASVSVTIDSLPDQKFSGRILRIAPQLDSQTRNGMVEIEIPNRNGALKGEMFARAELNLGSERTTTLLPRDALVYRGDQPGVYMIESEAAKFFPVETGLTQDDKVEVVNGLKLGDVVITRGSNLIKDGDRIRVQPAGQSGSGGANNGPGGKPNAPAQNAETKPAQSNPAAAGTGPAQRRASEK